MPTKPATVKDYLAGLPDDRRKAIEAIRKVIKKNLGKGFEEGIQYGMVAYYVPHSLYPDGYHCDASQPLPFAAVASQKNHIGLYLFCVYTDPKTQEWFVREWKNSGKRLDMGKSCVRAKKLEDIPMDVLAGLFQRLTVKDFVASYESQLTGSGSKRTMSSKKKAAKKPAAKKAAKKPAKKTVAKKPAAAKKPAKKKVVKKKKSASRRG